MAKIKVYSLIIEIFAALIGAGMIVVGAVLYPPSAELVAFLILTIGGGLFIICGIILIIFDVKRKEETVDAEV
ncbi:MAG: hypothetical protein ACTSQB_07085 [Candidatus Heimdallarchaeota archaeon]